jgi:hypothetical protein
MKEQFLNYEQALALKELGFDEECFGFYYIDTDVNYNQAICFSTDIINDFGDEPNDVLSPLYQQAFRWFREKYNLYQDISAFAWNYDKKQLGFSIRTYLNPVNIETERKVYGEVYETYEEAELECLKKLIEIVNEQHR